MSQIIKVRPKVELRAMQVKEDIHNTNIIEFFTLNRICGYSMIDKYVKIYGCSPLHYNYGDWFIQYTTGEYGVLTDKEFKEQYDIITDQPYPTTINNITLNIANNSHDDFGREIMEVVKKYGVGK